ncbi:MAG: pimeloyl-ACP methyl ester carboxylesterase [Halioglobus sp.]|jgi:pimeloyl-ACP methyl ester carboxylesterase
MNILITLLLIVVAVVFLRRMLADKEWPAPPAEAFEGTMLRLGENLVAFPDRSHLDADLVAQTTVVCFPGFVEDMRYFLEVYHDVPAQLILVNNANYQNPFKVEVEPAPDWFTSNPHPLGTIAHDAYCVNQVLEHLTGPERVVLHGHSRGGAVVLETGNQQPERAASVEAILEAAVVPQGRLFNDGEKKLQPVGFFLFPFVFSLMRVLPESTRLQSPMMWVTNATKNRIVATIPFTPRQYSTAVVNSSNIIAWQAGTGYESYDNFKRVTLFVGERDHVLSRSAMINSAGQREAVTIIETAGTDHFPSLEDPAQIQSYYS